MKQAMVLTILAVAASFVNGARKVRRVGASKGALEKCGSMPRKEHVCRYGRME